MTTIGSRIAAVVPRLLVVCHDLTMVWLCWNGLLSVRYSYVVGALPRPWFSTEVVIVLVAQGLVFWAVGLYRGLWRFASVADLWNIARASAFGLFCIAVGLFLYNRLEGVPRLVLALYMPALVMLLGAPRLLYRAWKDRRLAASLDQPRSRVLVLGAGSAGEALVRDMRRDGRYRPIGFLDDKPSLQRARLQGLPVLGSIERLPQVAREVAAQLVVIAIPTASPEQMQRIVRLCEQARIPFRAVPRLSDVLGGRVAPGELKEVAIEDLLGREPVAPDWRAVRDWLAARSVLVTGAGGSIGSELCRQVARLGVGHLTLLEHSELALETIAGSLRATFPALTVDAVLGDCGDPAVIAHALRRGRPDTVFHAAAYKHVPVLQVQLREAIRNNVLATQTVATAAARAGVRTFVLISTDKAVNPANVLGASKRWAEMVCQSLAEQSECRFVTVRFGNVLDSAGSVVPLFRAQIRAGGPVTVTDPEVTRYFMTIPEACQLILQAGALAPHQAIYTLDMGQPVRIRDLAEQMIRLSGPASAQPVQIVYTGLRPGEKLHETLFHAEEDYRRTPHPRIFEAEQRPVAAARIAELLVQARAAVASYDEAALQDLLQRAVPDYEAAPIHSHESRSRSS
ncbi:MAG: nucleoside-diphosphate sugar epimerase/dehydratase [Xanthomonadaceae bacterium]|nr:nucleoside-diphosphate sugar epimerase/dehydratase [Xanthomonadaceae bacterium]